MERKATEVTDTTRDETCKTLANRPSESATIFVHRSFLALCPRTNPSASDPRDTKMWFWNARLDYPKSQEIISKLGRVLLTRLPGIYFELRLIMALTPLLFLALFHPVE